MSWSHEVAWAAGFFDGEGHARFDAVNKRTQARIGVMVSQKERAPLERFQAAMFGLGKIQFQNPYKDHGAMWRWGVYNWRDAQAVAAAMWPFLCEVKRRQLADALSHVPEIQLRPYRYRHDAQTHCPHGHPRADFGYPQGLGRVGCRECNRLRWHRGELLCVDCARPITIGAERCRSCAGKQRAVIRREAQLL